ncbi:hypothetical protein [Kaarinaea lacus]
MTDTNSLKLAPLLSMASQQQTKVLLFLFSFLLVQGVVVLTEFEHPLHNADSSCEICIAVDHLSSGLITLESGNHLWLQNELDTFPGFSPYFQSHFTAFSVRAPPAL